MNRPSLDRCESLALHGWDLLAWERVIRERDPAVSWKTSRCGTLFMIQLVKVFMPSAPSMVSTLGFRPHKWQLVNVLLSLPSGWRKRLQINLEYGKLCTGWMGCVLACEPDSRLSPAMVVAKRSSMRIND